VLIDRRNNGSYNVQVHAKSLDGLKKSKLRLNELINGSRLDLEEKDVVNLRQAESRKIIAVCCIQFIFNNGMI